MGKRKSQKQFNNPIQMAVKQAHVRATWTPTKKEKQHKAYRNAKHNKNIGEE